MAGEGSGQNKAVIILFKTSICELCQISSAIPSDDGDAR